MIPSIIEGVRQWFVCHLSLVWNLTSDSGTNLWYAVVDLDTNLKLCPGGFQTLSRKTNGLDLNNLENIIALPGLL